MAMTSTSWFIKVPGLNQKLHKQSRTIRLTMQNLRKQLYLLENTKFNSLYLHGYLKILMNNTV